MSSFHSVVTSTRLYHDRIALHFYLASEAPPALRRRQLPCTYIGQCCPFQRLLIDGSMNVNVVYTVFVVIMHVEVIVRAQDPCTPWIYNIEFRKCYRKYCDTVSPMSAQKVCQQQDGNLVTICNEAENNFFALMGFVATGYPNQDPAETWIGLRRNPNNRMQFIWMSGSSCNYT
ncbi:hypothetical protein GCK32_013588, partial [Trichostrongylus colubriformis]